MSDTDSGWQIGIYRADADPDNHAEDEEPTEGEERAAMAAAGIEPEDRIEPGTWMAAIPSEWAEQLRKAVDNAEEEGHTAPNEWKVTTPDGRQWTIEVPLP